MDTRTNAMDDLERFMNRMYLPSKCLSVFPLRVSQGNFEISHWSSAYFLSILAIMIYNSWETQRSEGLSLIEKMIQFVAVFLMLSIPLTNQLWLLINKKKMTQCLSLLIQIQTRLKVKLTNDTNYTGAVALLVMSAHTINFSRSLHSYSLGAHVGSYLLYMAVFTIFGGFCSALQLIRMFYKNICDKLNDRVATEFIAIHDSLMECCYLVNYCYSPQILLFMMGAPVSFVVLLYYYSVLIPDLSFLFWGILVLIPLVNFITNCRETMAHANIFNDRLYQLVINDNSEMLVRNDRVKLHYQRKKELQFSTFGFINLDNGALCSMVSTVTTYFLILVQFRE